MKDICYSVLSVRRRGVTLVEMILVVVIMSLMGSYAFAHTSGMSAKATVYCVSAEEITGGGSSETGAPGNSGNNGNGNNKGDDHPSNNGNNGEESGDTGSGNGIRLNKFSGDEPISAAITLR